MTATVDRPFDPMGQFTGVAGDVRNPYPGFHARRTETPVFTHPDGSVEVFTYDLNAAVMRDNVTFCSGSIRELMSVAMGPYPLVGMDEPEHKRLRSLVAQAFRQRMLAHWDEDLVVPVVDGMIDRFADRGSAELVNEFTYRYPVQVIAEVLGLSRDDHEYFHPRALAVINVAVRPDEGIAASEELRDYFANVLEERRANPGSDLISELCRAELDGETLGDEEIFSFLRLLLPAGAETTYRATGSFIYGLLTHPDQFEALKADRSLMTQAIEESIRWESPLLITSRECSRRHRARRSRDPEGRGRHHERRLVEPRPDPVAGRRRVRHLPGGQAAHRVRRRRPHVPGHAPGPHGDGERDEPPARPVPEPAAGSRTAGTPTTCTSTASGFARPRRCPYCSTRERNRQVRGRRGQAAEEAARLADGHGDGWGGDTHFTNPGFYEAIVPDWVPGSKKFWVQASGVAELACAALLISPRTRKLGGWLTAGTLVTRVDREHPGRAQRRHARRRAARSAPRRPRGSACRSRSR